MTMPTPEEFLERIEEMLQRPDVIAEMDQAMAHFTTNRDAATHWAALAQLADCRGNAVAQSTAVANLKSFLFSLETNDLTILVAYLLHNTLILAARSETDGDVEALIASLNTGPRMMTMEKFVATNGRSCAFCGFDNGYIEHDCTGGSDDDPSEG